MKLTLLQTQLLVNILQEITDYAVRGNLQHAYPIFHFPDGFQEECRTVKEILKTSKREYGYGFILQRINGHVGVLAAYLNSRHNNGRDFASNIRTLCSTLRSKIDYTIVTDEETFVKLVFPVLHLWQMMESIDIDTIFSSDNKFKPEDI